MQAKRRPSYPRQTCIVPGCPSSSTQFSSWFICGRHYRLGAPVGSPLRRALLRVRRLGRRYGWTDQLDRREMTLWTAIIGRATKRDREGFVDKAVIDRLMGWDESSGLPNAGEAS